MLTPKQSDAVASSLLMMREQDKKQMLRCPSCGAMSISPKARKNLLWHIQCQACKSYLRLKWGLLLLLGYLAAIVLLAVGAFIKIPGFHNFPAAMVVTWSLCLAISFQAINRRLPLEPKR
jgi:uncharacterized C2H2 Zn-finger protein